MAETYQESGLLNGTVAHSLSDDTGIVDTTHVNVDNEGDHDELIRQALAEANAFDSVSYAVSNEGSAVCDTGQGQDPADADLDGNHSESSYQTSTGVLHQPSDHLLNGTAEEIFSNGTGELLTNGTSENVLGDENITYAVNVDSLPEGHIISIPNDIMTTSIVSQNQTQLSNNCSDASQLLQDVIKSEYSDGSSSDLLQADSNSNLTTSQSIAVSQSNNIHMSQDVLQSVIQQVQAQQMAQQAMLQNKQTDGSTVPQQETISFTLVSPSPQANSPPLGSSQNPIRIIQQGNRYTPMQQLTPDQLQQIMQVVQQQHVSKAPQESNGAVIFNPQTNTRIMYRVIYPSELHKSQNSSVTTTYQVLQPTTSSQEQQTSTPHQKRAYRKRKDLALVSSNSGVDEMTDKNGSDAPELSKEEKEERKKHRPRTRSGRVSKPPKHMVQDYKHIHVLDWDEDYDDSDGGYSDFKHSDEEEKSKLKQEGEDESLASPELFPALGAGRPKNHKCQTCDKSYIGQAGLNRHYRLNPDHCTNPSETGSISSLQNGSIDGDDSKDASLQPDGSLSQMSDAARDGAKVSCNSVENYSEDSNTQDSINSLGATSPVAPRGRGRGGYRGRWAHHKHNAQLRRKNKLKDIMKQCTDEELMEVVLPRLVNSISVWEYLMMKSEKGGSRPQVDVIYHEFEALRQHVKKACTDYMKPLSQEELVDDNLQCKMIKVSDASLATCLDLDTVTYQVKEMPPGDSNSFSSLHNKLSAAAITMTTNKTIKEEVESVPVKRSQFSPSAAESAAKKPRLSTISTLPINTSTFTVTARLPFSEDEKVNYARSDSSLSSISSLSASSATSPQSVQIRVPSSTVTSSTITSSSPSVAQVLTSSSIKPTPTTVTVRSPYVHIACPTTKPQTVSYILAGSKPQPSPRGNKVPPVPVIISQPIVSSSQTIPYILSTSTSTATQQKVVVAAPNNPTTALASAQQPNTLLLAAAQNTAHKVVVRQPPQQTRLLLSSQPSTLKPHVVSVTAGFPSSSASTTLSSSRSLLSSTKPTEVKVSRQLFHETTSPPVATTPHANGRSSIKILSEVNSVYQTIPARTGCITVSSNHSDKSSKLGNSRSLVTPPSGQQFTASPSKAGSQVLVPDMDDIEALGSMEFTDDLGPLNTSTDSLNGGLSTGVGLGSAVDMAANCMVSDMDHFTHSQAADPSGEITTVVTSDSQSFTINGNLNGLEGISYINGSSSDFSSTSSSLKMKDNMKILSDMTFSTSVSDFIMSKPSTTVLTSTCKDVLNSLQTQTYNLSSNGVLNGQDLKGETSTSMTMADISGLQFTDPNTDSSVHLNGISPILQADDQQDDAMTLLSQHLTGAEVDGQMLNSRDMVMGDTLPDEEDGQLFLTEGSSIYQTEDGTFIIQSSNGNTYQLQGAQGLPLPLETLQALLSGSIDPLAGENVGNVL
ncbi:serine-rich adhesin for platelets-like [Physella acuta]|uniref:serine-rich adhesin for platelets-like n=1 Tax=Physella acuta TaxID=109671 RepID=UPI0027DB383B|nr:serine-rich adhesin for platelets-like [Physella acuta]